MLLNIVIFSILELLIEGSRMNHSARIWGARLRTARSTGEFRRYCETTYLTAYTVAHVFAVPFDPP